MNSGRSTWKHFVRRGTALACFSLLAAIQAPGGVYVFFEKGFPSVENSAISRAALERALAPLEPRFIGLGDLQKGTRPGEGDLLILPYGSAFPADAWTAIRRQIVDGNLLVLGGRPLCVPVFGDSLGWRADPPTFAYARSAGIEDSYEAPQHGPWTIRWEEDAVFFEGCAVNPRRVFVNAGRSGRYRGLGLLVDGRGNRLAAPAVADDIVGGGRPPHRRVYLSFDADQAYWGSEDGIALMRRAARYASLGGVRLWLDFQNLTVDAGEPVSGAVDLVRRGEPAVLTVDFLSGTKVLASKTFDCGNLLHEEIRCALSGNAHGLITVRATLSSGDTMLERYTSGVAVHDASLLRSGAHLEPGRDYFRLDGKPYLMVGTNYFSTDLYTRSFFVGGSIGGNAWVWERDFAEMERLGLTAVRTGIWLNRERYLDVVSGAADERLLRAIESYLLAAARHHVQVIFTFFAFDPQLELHEGEEGDGERHTPVPNPYLDPAAIESEGAYVRAVASRFRDVPFLSYDLINEPSVSNPGRLWKGNTPNGDPVEVAAWHEWLGKKYGTAESLAVAWHTTPAEIGAPDRVPLPAFADLDLSRSGNLRTVRALDYNLFAQELFCRWADSMIAAIRSAGARQPVTVGQDEGGVTDRVLNQFWAASAVSFTVDHTWWRDDALLWNSIAAKTPDKPNIIGETGPQPVWGMDGAWRWDDVQGLGLEERKLVLGFAAANTGILHWDWSRDEDYSLLRRDGSYKLWLDALAGIGAFARAAEPYASESVRPDVALVLPQSLQLSTFGSWGLAVQQNAVRALYNYARGSAVAAGEYQLGRMPQAKLIIVPAPWVMRQESWDLLMGRVRAGATLLVSGRIDADEHWRGVPGRTKDWNTEYRPAAMTAREAQVTWPGGNARLSYSGDRTTYAEQGMLGGGRTFAEITLGAGRILYFADPLELADQTEAIGRIYGYAMKRAGVAAPYVTACDDPGILICPTRLPDATLYVLTSESAVSENVAFRDNLSGTDVQVNISPGRGALLLVGRDGRIPASYNTK